jgi:hypothetical protein
VPDAGPDPTTAALLSELGRRTDVCWVRHGEVVQAVWHAWVDEPDGGALVVVSGGDEQPFPEVPAGGPVEVTMRSKDTGGRLLTWAGRADVVRPGDEAWPAVTSALLARRLNLLDPATAAERWARTSVVRRVVPV